MTVRALPKSLPQQALRYFRDPGVKTWRKFVGVAALAYAIMPVDFIPDVIPLLGWMDDFGVLSAALFFVTRDIQKHAASETGPSVGPAEPSEFEREINPPPPSKKR